MSVASEHSAIMREIIFQANTSPAPCCPACCTRPLGWPGRVDSRSYQGQVSDGEWPTGGVAGGLGTHAYYKWAWQLSGGKVGTSHLLLGFLQVASTGIP